MKILLGIIFLVICTYIGYFLSKKYTIRKDFYCDFYNFNKKLKNEIDFAQKSIKEIISPNINSKSIFYKGVCDSVLENRLPQIDKNIFSQEEIVFFNTYLESIGGSDKNTQIKFLETAGVKIDESKIKCKEEEKKYKSLYIKLGFLIGLIALIIIL